MFATRTNLTVRLVRFATDRGPVLILRQPDVVYEAQPIRGTVESLGSDDGRASQSIRDPTGGTVAAVADGQSIGEIVARYVLANARGGQSIRSSGRGRTTARPRDLGVTGSANTTKP